MTQPVSRNRHQTRRWRRSQGYAHTASTLLVPLAVTEVAKAALTFPLGFIERDGGWTLAAVLGLLPGQNLYIGRNGTWSARYIPAGLQAYPFSVGRTDKGEPMLCVDEGSGLVFEGSEGEPFFDETGGPSAMVSQIWAALIDTMQGEALLRQICGQLHAAGVIELWPIKIKGADGTQKVLGLHRINEAALNGLDDATSRSLRQAGGIGIAYAQLLSMGNLSDLGHLAQARAQAEAAERARAAVKPMISLPEDSSIDWDWSKIGKP